MRLGNTDIASVKLGSSQVQAVYLGNSLVWQNAPTAIAATGVGTTSFTAEWEAYSGAYLYLLDVSESSDFSTFVYQNQVIYAPTTSYVVIGLNSNTTYYYRVRASDFELEAQDFFDRVADAGGTLSATEKDAVNILVTDMKSDGIWTKMKAIYPMVGASAAACAQNLKSSSFTGTFNGGWTFASTGATPNGVDAWADTYLLPSTQLSLNSTHVSVYIRGTNTNSQVYIGARHTQNLGYIYALNYGYIAVNNTDLATTVDDSVGFYHNNRSASNVLKRIKNGVVGNTYSTSSTQLPDQNIILAAFYNSSDSGKRTFSNNENAFASIGDGLTDDEAGYLYNAVQAFQTTLNREV